MEKLLAQEVQYNFFLLNGSLKKKNGGKVLPRRRGKKVQQC
jgi:hypothetical protein